VLVADDAHGVLYRVDDRVGVDRARRHVAVAATLRDLGVPAIRLVGNDPVVATTAGVAVTAWELEDLLDGPVDPATVGALARQLHAATAVALGEGRIDPAVAAFDPLGVVAEQLGAATGTDDVALLQQRLAEVGAAWVVADPLPTGIVHGDLHVDNVLTTRRGPVLADLELAGVGPVAYDLVAPLVAVERYGADPTTLDDYLAAYGTPLPDTARHGPLRDAYELWLTAWAVANRHLDADHEAEAQRRMQRWRTPDGDLPRWTLR
jgi:Ser/Thr protein kinase RdoA (MazF antagonist)